jgi:hypothetical protein
VVLASLVTEWKQTLLILKPDTLLRWHCQGFKLLWKLKSKSKSKECKPKISDQTITLIKKLAKENKLRGAERIRGGFLKLNIKVAKRTVQKYRREIRTTSAPNGQKWSSFLNNHANEIGACDFLPVTNLFGGAKLCLFHCRAPLAPSSSFRGYQPVLAIFGIQELGDNVNRLSDLPSS